MNNIKFFYFDNQWNMIVKASKIAHDAQKVSNLVVHLNEVHQTLLKVAKLEQDLESINKSCLAPWNQKFNF